jgi:hypothetical protein
VLLGNYSVLNKNPGRALGGSTVADSRGAWNKPGAMRNRFVADRGDGWTAKTSQPSGVRPPYTWLLPITAGGMSTAGTITGSSEVTASVAGGRNAQATLTGSSTVTATLQLVVSAVAALSGSSTVNAELVGKVAVAAALSGSSSVTAAIEAIAWATATLAGSSTVNATPSATGELVCNITPFTELSPQNLAAAVWNTVADTYDEAGTFGAELNLLHVIARNKVVTDPTAGTITVYDTDGTTVLWSADLFEDAAGTQTYRGQGAERRDQYA